MTLSKAYRLKDDPAPPTIYLGATISEWNIYGEQAKIWRMSSQNYVKEAIRCVELELAKQGLTLKGKPMTPMQSKYRPKLDVSPLLNPEQANYYMSLIGIL